MIYNNNNSSTLTTTTSREMWADSHLIIMKKEKEMNRVDCVI